MPSFDQYVNDTDTVFVDGVRCIGETDKAVHVLFDDGEKAWIPKSHLRTGDNEIKEQDDQGLLVISTWLAREKGWWT
jgi:hypothetical protein